MPGCPWTGPSWTALPARRGGWPCRSPVVKPSLHRSSLPRPAWYTENLGTRAFRDAIADARFREQYTDAVGGNWSAVVLNEGQTSRIAFVSYYKGEYTLRTLERKEPLHTAASADFGSAGPIIDFQAPLQHTLVSDNIRKKKFFEKMFLEGRPPVNVGVTSNGDVFGGTAVAFGDVLGDKQFTFTAASIAQYRTFALTYASIGQRFQFALQGYSQTLFFYGQLSNVFYDPLYSGFIDRSLAQATTTLQGGRSEEHTSELQSH